MSSANNFRELVQRAHSTSAYIAPVSTIKESASALTFSVLVLEVEAKTSQANNPYKKVTFTPFGLGNVQPHDVTLGDGTKVALFTYASADRTALYSRVVQNAAKVLELSATPFILVERGLYSINIMRGEVPAAGALATVFNAHVEYYNKDLQLNSRDIVDIRFREINKNTTPSERLRYAFHDQTMRVPPIMPYMTMVPHINFAEPLWNQKPSVKAVCNTLPLVRLLINRLRTEYAWTDANADPWKLALALPGIEPAPVAGPMVEATFCLLPDKFYSAGQENYPDKTVFKMTLLAMQYPDVAAPDPDVDAFPRFVFKDVVLYGNECAGLGACHPLVLKTLLQMHPIPFEILLAPNLFATLVSNVNRDVTGQSRRGFDSGEYTSAVHFVAWHLLQYLEQLALEVDHETVVLRYGPTVLPYRQADYNDVTKETPVKKKDGGTFLRPAIKTPLATSDTSRIVALDEYTGVLPAAAAYRFYALPLFDTGDAVTYTRDAKGNALKVDMSVADGSKYVRSKRNARENNPAKPHHAWLLPAPEPAFEARRVPMFLFYAVRTLAADAPTLVPTAVEAPLDDPALSATLDDLRLRLLDTVLDEGADHGVKRTADAAGLDEEAADAPDPKEARVEVNA